MCRLLQSVVMCTGVCPWARVFRPHDSKNTAKARGQPEISPHRTTRLRFPFVFMSFLTTIIYYSVYIDHERLPAGARLGQYSP